MLLPLASSLDELIPVDHPARVINELFGGMDLGEVVGSGPVPSEKPREVVLRLNKEISECLADEKEERAKKLKTLELSSSRSRAGISIVLPPGPCRGP
jgi:hypothetical protein